MLRRVYTSWSYFSVIAIFGYHTAMAQAVRQSLAHVAKQPVDVAAQRHHAAHPKALQNLGWNRQQHSLELGAARFHIGYQMVCGYYDNQALYASFGLERQIFKCSKIEVPLGWSYHKWQATLEWAPLYDAIMAKSYDSQNSYGQDSHERPIYGSQYEDWYKNLGTRIYYLGNFPILEASIAYHFTPGQTLKAGRMRQAVGLLDDETPWGDDGMFSPYAYWLSRNLLTGASYAYQATHFALQAAILSGNNPMKGYANYLDHIQSPNIKANNTPSLALQVGLPLAGWWHMAGSSILRAGVLVDTMSSTWATAPKDGKRRNSVYALAWRTAWQLNPAWSIAWFGQYTWYLSGLKTDSNQVHENSGKPYKNITQQGIFSGVGLAYRACELSYTFAMFDRFDANVYAKFLNLNHFFLGQTLAQLQAMHQYTHIINLRYHFNHFFSLQANYLAIDNPLPWVSNILDNKPDYRFNVGFDFNF